jgi:drug/metabolite transporter (DMT)-like permease
VLASAAMVGSAACWGSATVMSKGALNYLPPFTLLVVQLGASVAALWTALVATGQSAPLSRANRQAALSGLLEPGLAYAVGTMGLLATGASHASVIAATEPLFIVLLGWAFLGTRPGMAAILAMMTAVPGMLLVSGVDPPGARNSVHGDLLIALATGFAASYVVLSSRLARTIAPLPLAALQQSVGLAFAMVLLTVATLAGWERVSLSLVPPDGWLLAVLSGLVQYALAFWLYLYGLRTLSLSAAGLALALTPVFGASGAMLFLGERLTSWQLIGCAVVVGAVAAAAAARR